MIQTNIRELRESQDMRLRELARLTNINPGQLSDIERGIRIPTNEQVTAMAEVLGHPIEMEIAGKIKVAPR